MSESDNYAYEEEQERKALLQGMHQPMKKWYNEAINKAIKDKFGLFPYFWQDMAKWEFFLAVKKLYLVAHEREELTGEKVPGEVLLLEFEKETEFKEEQGLEETAVEDNKKCDTEVDAEEKGWSKLKLKDLREALVRRGLSSAGKKAELVKRLQFADKRGIQPKEPDPDQNQMESEEPAETEAMEKETQSPSKEEALPDVAELFQETAEPLAQPKELPPEDNEQKSDVALSDALDHSTLEVPETSELLVPTDSQTLDSTDSQVPTDSAPCTLDQPDTSSSTTEVSTPAGPVKQKQTLYQKQAPRPQDQMLEKLLQQVEEPAEGFAELTGNSEDKEGDEHSEKETDPMSEGEKNDDGQEGEKKRERKSRWGAKKKRSRWGDANPVNQVLTALVTPVVPALPAVQSTTEGGDDNEGGEEGGEPGKKKRRSRWGAEETPPESSVASAIFPDLNANLSQEQVQEMMVMQMKLKQVNENLALLPEEVIKRALLPPHERSPSPPPVYDQYGNRTNTWEVVTKKRLNDERQEIIESMIALNPLFKPPADFRTSRPTAKLYIPTRQYPGYNFIGLIIGPRGNTQKRLQQETGCKIQIRGKGAVKEGSKGRQIGSFEDQNDELHVFIMGDTKEQVEKAKKEVEKLLVPIEDTDNEHKARQLRELALINGTLKDDEYCHICGDKGHRQFECPKRQVTRKLVDIKCGICGDSSHPTRDCAQKKTGGVPSKQHLDQEYLSFMAELSGEKPPGTSGSAPSIVGGVPERAEEKRGVPPRGFGYPPSAQPTGPRPIATVMWRGPPRPPGTPYPGHPAGIAGGMALPPGTVAPWDKQGQQPLTGPRAGIGYASTGPRPPPYPMAPASGAMAPPPPQSQPGAAYSTPQAPRYIPPPAGQHQMAPPPRPPGPAPVSAQQQARLQGWGQQQQQQQLMPPPPRPIQPLMPPPRQPLPSSQSQQQSQSQGGSQTQSYPRPMWAVPPPRPLNSQPRPPNPTTTHNWQK